MKISELESKNFLSLHNEPIHFAGAVVGGATLSIPKAAIMAKNIVQILKQVARKEYSTYFIQLED